MPWPYAPDSSSLKQFSKSPNGKVIVNQMPVVPPVAKFSGSSPKQPTATGSKNVTGSFFSNLKNTVVQGFSDSVKGIAGSAKSGLQALKEKFTIQNLKNKLFGKGDTSVPVQYTFKHNPIDPNNRLTKFLRAISSSGFSRDYSFTVHYIKGGMEDLFPEGVAYYCRAIKMPSRTVLYDYTYHKGIPFMVPSGVDYSNNKIELSFLLDEYHTVKRLFESLALYSYDEHNNISRLLTDDGYDLVMGVSFDDTQNDIVAFYEFHGISVESVGQVDYNRGGNGKPQEIPVTLRYDYYTLEYKELVMSSVRSELAKPPTGGGMNIGMA